MEKDEILKNAKEKKALVGEMEKSKINKACWIANIIACVVATAFMIIQGALGNFASLYAIACICMIWASVFFFCQYFIAKRPWQVLIGGVLEAVGSCIMLTMYILYTVGIL